MKKRPRKGKCATGVIKEETVLIVVDTVIRTKPMKKPAKPSLDDRIANIARGK